MIEKTIEQLEARKAEIAAEVDSEGADLDALENEVRAINAELETRKHAAEERAAKAAAVLSGAGTVIDTKPETEERKMDQKEIRDSKAYIEAYANFIKYGNDAECRALLSMNASSGGTVPVPTFLEGYIRTNWESNELLALIRRSYVPGNLQVGFELSATEAVWHDEGAEAPAEEVLTIGTVLLLPKMAKKWISVSNEALAMGGEEFLRYIYDEITYKIAQLEASRVVSDIVAAVGAATSTKPAVQTISAALALDTIIAADGMLSSAAADVTVVMNKSTYAAIRSLQLAANYAVDPFDGKRIVFTDALPAYATAGDNAAYMIVGDFRGYQANFPEGDNIKLKFDDTTLMPQDLIRILGRIYVGGGVVASNHFTVVTKPAGAAAAAAAIAKTTK